MIATRGSLTFCYAPARLTTSFEWTLLHSDRVEDAGDERGRRRRSGSLLHGSTACFSLPQDPAVRPKVNTVAGVAHIRLDRDRTARCIEIASSDSSPRGEARGARGAALITRSRPPARSKILIHNICILFAVLRPSSAHPRPACSPPASAAYLCRSTSASAPCKGPSAPRQHDRLILSCTIQTSRDHNIPIK